MVRHNVSGGGGVILYIVLVIERSPKDPFRSGAVDIGNVASYEFPSYRANFTTEFALVNSVSRATRTSAMCKGTKFYD